MKRFLSVFLVFAFVIGVWFSAPFTLKAIAAEVDDLSFELNNNGKSYYVSDCNESVSGDLEIPSTYNDLPVTSIGSSAFYNCTSLTSIDLSECTDLTSIGGSAFNDCTSLTSIDLGECTSITSIGDSVAENTLINSLTEIPPQLSSIAPFRTKSKRRPSLARSPFAWFLSFIFPCSPKKNSFFLNRREFSWWH